MKYMGSKRAMLQNGLGELLSREIRRAPRFVDLFAGSGAVAIHVASRFPVQVAAYDIQSYTEVLAGAVLERERRMDWESVWVPWKDQAEALTRQIRVPAPDQLTQSVVWRFRDWAANQSGLPITQAYGGHYYSPQQSVWIDSLLATLPERKPARSVALAALIQAASACATAPGQTAQPFQPTRTAKRFLAEAWKRDIPEKTQRALQALAAQCAQRRGVATVKDANKAAAGLQEGDLAFIDPPYSGVHYSRFYHVLETIARGRPVVVSGTGRYPSPAERPQSRYSLQSEASQAFDELRGVVAFRGARAIVTFPEHRCSNGLSGESARSIAEKRFRIASQSSSVISRFSTLGGTSGARKLEGGRAARQQARELMLVLEPN